VLAIAEVVAVAVGVAVAAVVTPDGPAESVEETGFRRVRLAEGTAVGVAWGLAEGLGITATCGDGVERGRLGDGDGDGADAVRPETAG
jgi:hypothetical protein